MTSPSAAAWQAALGGVLPLQWGQDSLGGWQRSLLVKWAGGDSVWWGRLELDAEYQPGNGHEQGDAGLFLRYVIGR